MKPEQLIAPPMNFPETGRSREAVLRELRERKAGDIDWQTGRSPVSCR